MDFDNTRASWPWSKQAQAHKITDLDREMWSDMVDQRDFPSAVVECIRSRAKAGAGDPVLLHLVLKTCQAYYHAFYVDFSEGKDRATRMLTAVPAYESVRAELEAYCANLPGPQASAP
jgi:hypothetical protein